MRSSIRNESEFRIIEIFALYFAVRFHTHFEKTMLFSFELINRRFPTLSIIGH